jgi:predicted nucleic acid-binding protein
MIVVSNTTPIIALSSARQIRILKLLFSKIIITEEVKDELLAKKRYGSKFPSLKWVEIQEVKDRDTLESLATELGRGEASVIALGKEINPDFVFIDEKQGYNKAKDFGLIPIRTLAILEAAKKAGLIKKLKPIVSRIVKKGGWYKKALIEKYLKDNNENH